MKVKTIAAIAMAVSASSAHALIGPGHGNDGQPAPKLNTVCLRMSGPDAQGSLYASDCDEAAANAHYERQLNASGCAEGQIAIQTYSLSVTSCPTYVQL